MNGSSSLIDDMLEVIKPLTLKSDYEIVIFPPTILLSYIKNKLKSLYKELIDSINKIDLSLKNSAKSSEARQIAILESLEKKIVKFQKRNIKTTIKSLEKIYDKIYPKNIFQERKINYSEFYCYKGDDLIDSIYKTISPFDNALIIAKI
jgi:uncharacterized protein YllA (UPF0747 family)